MVSGTFCYQVGSRPGPGVDPISEPSRVDMEVFAKVVVSSLMLTLSLSV